MMQIEFPFTLPCGFVDAQGMLHCEGVMRLATALDEVEPLQDPRVRQNEAYLGILLLSRVVVRLGSFSPVPVPVIERLFAADFSFLQELYLQINESGSTMAETACPTCRTHFLINTAHGGA